MSVRVINGKTRRLNWKRQPKDLSDIKLHHVCTMRRALPPAATTVTIAAPAIRDQGDLGSCTQNGGAEAMGFMYMKLRKVNVDPMFSRLFGYYFTRQLEGTPANEDSGCNVRDVFKSYNKYGICLESTWAYDIKMFSQEPSTAAQAEALSHKALTYVGCDDLQSIKQAIVSGMPIIFGFDCYESFQSDTVSKTGIVPMPQSGEEVIGGHCMFLDSYDDRTKTVSGINSYGDDWGDRGRFHMPYDFWTHGLASDATALLTEEVTV